MNKFFTMIKAELKLSFRGMDMIIFAINMSVAVAVILGVIYGNRLAFPGAKYFLEGKFFGALSTIAICAGASWDFHRRSEKLWQEILRFDKWQKGI